MERFHLLDYIPFNYDLTISDDSDDDNFYKKDRFIKIFKKKKKYIQLMGKT